MCVVTFIYIYVVCILYIWESTCLHTYFLIVECCCCFFSPFLFSSCLYWFLPKHICFFLWFARIISVLFFLLLIRLILVFVNDVKSVYNTFGSSQLMFWSRIVTTSNRHLNFFFCHKHPKTIIPISTDRLFQFENFRLLFLSLLNFSRIF